ncbi:hypothetical protein LVJ83_03220 [Uruburuella testudinis]|uniref:Uncharacterized protein n=1 Tax=Uruburuella testudinis TaxID=1282863 RepID=A0ABY4DVY2_9NEIS|nr:hypothetical protein [Uruburuella testudinis]UOO83193.1 hypothetical protein LVJ83_03220 [Uruburuella testudinis]
MTLLLVTFVLALAVSYLAARLFAGPLQSILQRIIDDPISRAWVRYMKFAILVVGVSSGVRIGELEKYITPWQFSEKSQIVPLTGERWVLEVYRTVIESLQGIAWMLLVFFVFALMAYVVVRLGELKRNRSGDADKN